MFLRSGEKKDKVWLQNEPFYYFLLSFFMNHFWIGSSTQYGRWPYRVGEVSASG